MMNNFFEDLKEYFERTPQERILEEWARSAEFDAIGPTVESFFETSQHYRYVYLSEPYNGCIQNRFGDFNPKFSSGFFIN